MNLITVILFSIISVLAAVSLKAFSKNFDVYFLLAASVFIFGFIITQLSTVIEFMSRLSIKASFQQQHWNILLKIIGICFVGEFSSSICKENGLHSLSSKVDIACKCSILVISIPVFEDILRIIEGLIV